MQDDIELIKKEYETILKELANPELVSDWQRFEEVSRQKKKLEKVMEKIDELDKIREQILENKEISVGPEDEELASLARIELSNFQTQAKTIEGEIKNFLKPQDKEDYQDAIIEIRAGTGGEEASLFAGDLFRMYSRYASQKGWALKILDSHATDLRGFKEIIFAVQGPGAFSSMKYEGGVHRVQRIPNTERAGRIHTSTATVATLAKPKTNEIQIRKEDLRVDYYKASGPGGQYVNKTESAVRLTHLPSGIVVASQTERNQIKNRENAMAILAAKLLEKQSRENKAKVSGARKSQIGGAKRAEKIRTYNFPQDRITDHRIKKSWNNITSIMDGDLDKILEELKSQRLTEPLQEF